ncbi:type I endonuclease-methyltransferase fusion protein [Planctomycetales bacterium]|nr:type I endonuclease-methyltransferase fusion protein [Planctomycetales bacterium]
MFEQGLAKLGFASDDDALFLIDPIPNELQDIDILFHLDKAKDFGATAVYLRKQLNGSYRPQVYLYDKTDVPFSEKKENELSDIQKNIWTSGEVPLVCVFYKTDITILDCTKHITGEYKPEYLIERLNLAGKAHDLYNEQFAVKVKSGIFWDEEELRDKFKFQNSAYDKLIENIKIVDARLKQEIKTDSPEIITKIIVQSILIKYLEERIDSAGNKLLLDKYFKRCGGASTFGGVLQNGTFVELLDDLNDAEKGFNGNVFKWETEEKQRLKELDLSVLAELLATDKSSLDSRQRELKFPDWRYFEFRYIPVELISRLYEEFLGKDKQKNGLYYTPAHLAKLLVDECLPLKKYQDINPLDYKILDPACGSGIFLVIAFKRLVQIWKLRTREANTAKMPSPPVSVLKKILRNMYGVDKEEQAIRLSSFSLSLALCDELEPKKIIDELKFDDLLKENLICSDFFTCEKIKDKKFDLVIGNPPFIRGGVEGDDKTWKIGNERVKIPQRQIALKFLAESFSNLKDKGLVCLIIKSSGLLYNSTSSEYKKMLFSSYNAIQIFDFTALARNKSLWDNDVDVESAAVFVRNEPPDYSRNILHLTFRRTKATKERIVFEMDDYDLHFVNRRTAIENDFIWKINLLGGGRIKTTIEKLADIGKFKDLFQDKGIYGEGTSGAKSLPNQAFSTYKIASSFLTEEYINSFKGKKDKKIFACPNFLVKENIDLPFCLNVRPVKFSNEIVGFHSEDNHLLNDILAYFIRYHNILKFYNICTSGKMLVYKNTACKQEDILNLPINLNIDLLTLLSDFDSNIIDDVNNVMQVFLRKENSIAVQSTKRLELLHYGAEFSRALNTIYENNGRKFRLSDVIKLENSLIAAVFRYDSLNDNAKFHTDLSKLNITGLTNNEISPHLSANRIVRLSPQNDMIVFIKPNQYRYWLSLIAYRDADKCFADLADAGF